MPEAYFEKQYKSTFHMSYCSECGLNSVHLPLPNDKNFINCSGCGCRLEISQRIVDVWQDPKYTTASC